MEILAICATGQKRGNISKLIDNLALGVGENNNKIKIIYLSDYIVKPCMGCWGCYGKEKCIIDDDMEKIYEKFKRADYIVFATPVYHGNVSGIMKNFMDRCFGSMINKIEGVYTYNTKNRIDRLKYMIKFGMNLKGKREISNKRIKLIISLNKPRILSFITGDTRHTIKSMKYFIKSISGIYDGSVISYNTFFGENKGKEDIYKKAYLTGKTIKDKN